MPRIARAVLTVVVTTGLLVVAAPTSASVAPLGPSAPSTVACPAPLPGPRAIVQLAYLVLLRRCPDAAGAAAWEATLRDGRTVRAVADRLVASREAREVVVGDAFDRVLGRPASAADRRAWAAWLQPAPGHPRRHDHLLAELAASPEVFAAAGATAEGFVDAVYARLVGRAPSRADRAYWVGRLRSGGDRRTVARALLRLDEPLAAVVRAAWAEVLGTMPSPTQLRDHVAWFRADGDRGAVSARLVGSPAFARRADARALVRPGRYVALGDSYVVGEGNGPDGESDDGCSRSVAGYPEVARKSSAAVPGTLDVVACSGATLASLHAARGEGGETYPGQLAALSQGEEPDLVSLTIGGNDVGFVSILGACLRVDVGGTQVNPSYDRARCGALLDRTAPARLAELRTGQAAGGRPLRCDGHRCTLAAAVADIRGAAPGARVVVVGYPPLMVAGGTCSGPLLFDDGRPALGGRWSVAPEHVRKGRAVVAGLNAVLRDAAVAAGATFVDPAPRFAGHSACSADPWLNGLRLVSPQDLLTAPSSFHPTRRGGVAQAAALVSALGG